MYRTVKPIYIMKVAEKDCATEALPRYISWWAFLQEKIFKAYEAKENKQKQSTVMITPDEVFEAFLQINDDLSISTDV